MTVDEIKRGLKLIEWRDKLRSRAAVVRQSPYLQVRYEGLAEEVDALEGMRNEASWDLRRAMAEFYSREADHLSEQIQELGIDASN